MAKKPKKKYGYDGIEQRARQACAELVAYLDAIGCLLPAGLERGDFEFDCKVIPAIVNDQLEKARKYLAKPQPRRTK